ncbi:MAG: replication initiator protein [Microvirus sp.]|nr:MAG: replication initiator protein [Microvirus sp.]
MCLTPITLASKETVGCGKCMPCHLKYCNQWAFRFKIHHTHNPLAYCVTLTYDKKHLPLVQSDEGRVYMTLDKTHTQKFFKKIRKANIKRHGQKAPKISYLIAGEYGDKFKRPHYHAIIFSAHADDIIQSWEHGSIYFGKSDIQATLNYALKYTLKSRIYRLYHNHAPYIRPFMLCSQGIGAQLVTTKSKRYDYLNQETGEIQKNRRVIKCIDNVQLPDTVKSGGIQMSLPRYYQRIANITVDTEQFRVKSIEKAFKMGHWLNEQKLTTTQWKKMYQKTLWETSKTHMYDNEVLTSLINPIS